MSEEIIEVPAQESIIYAKNIFELGISKEKYTTGQIACTEDNNQYFLFNGNDWEPVDVKKTATGQLALNLYDINKSIVEQLGPMAKRKINGAIKACQESFDKDTDDNLYLLYGKEIGYFTILNRVKDNTEKNLMETAVDLLSEFSEIYDISYLETQKVVEFWIKYQDKITCLYLGGWDEGMVNFNG